MNPISSRIGDVGNPQLVDARQFHASGQIGIHAQVVIGIRRRATNFPRRRQVSCLRA
jgi:hypothetical protein